MDLFCRYFFNVSSSESQQVKLLTEGVNRILEKSQSRGQQQKHALTFSECVTILKNVAGGHGLAEHDLFLGENLSTIV